MRATSVTAILLMVSSGLSFPSSAQLVFEQSDFESFLGHTFHDAYPNPFNPQTTIRFDLDRSMDYSLTVWDVAGRLVQTLDQGRLAAGRYSFQWNADNLNSGVYLIRLKAGNRVQTSTVTLLK